MDIESQQLIDRSRGRLPIVMGVLNVTPDSFSDGGCYVDVDEAAKHALEMARAGAGLIDVGGESTRPGAARVSEGEQIVRVVPVIEAVRRELDAHHFEKVMISVDTTRCDVAAAALDAGAGMINDVSAGTEDEGILGLAGERGVRLCLMHMKGEPGNMQKDPRYEDVTGEVLVYLMDRSKAAEAAGCHKTNIWIDPGIGFGKTAAHNLKLLADLDRFVETGYGVLLGTSRKSMFYAVSPSTAKLPENREYATAVTSALGVAAGVACIRVHDVAANAQAIETMGAVIEAGEGNV
ncbi:Dihydropteroate synthase [Poriferisphaera corsica]|uniref:Dihydropteroate synthase n=1 Tax=Poriferisphaera corsica TaxID=2528020 RepID=A0A517YYV9_9BACT|nr:dihydropteroate synthase [Poriferisphaera corsica]QDU35405.1 Dihydropteroate synthase [Poriferisphaera corsica]